MDIHSYLSHETVMRILQIMFSKGKGKAEIMSLSRSEAGPVCPGPGRLAMFQEQPVQPQGGQVALGKAHEL